MPLEVERPSTVSAMTVLPNWPPWGKLAKAFCTGLETRAKQTLSHSHEGGAMCRSVEPIHIILPTLSCISEVAGMQMDAQSVLVGSPVR